MPAFAGTVFNAWLDAYFFLAAAFFLAGAFFAFLAGAFFADFFFAAISISMSG